MGRTSHAAIVVRELGIPALVGAAGALATLGGRTGEVTLSCAEGQTGAVYPGSVPFEVEEIDPRTLPRTRTEVLLNVGNPDKAMQLARLPSDGVGLARMEFIFAGLLGIHPLALLHPERVDDAAARTSSGGPRGTLLLRTTSSIVSRRASRRSPQRSILGA